MSVQLVEPHEADVLAWQLGMVADRPVLSVLLDITTGEAFEAVVSLTSGRWSRCNRSTRRMRPTASRGH